MKILIVGSDRHWAIENFYTKYLNLIEGTEAKLFPARSKFYDFVDDSLFNKIIHRLGISPFYREINKELLNLVESYRPDIVWVFKGMEIYPESLRTIRSLGIKTVNYNPDNPFIFSGKGSGNANVTNSLNLYDLHLTYNIEVMNRMLDELKIQCEFLPFAYDLPQEFEFTNDIEEIPRVCFLGNPDKERASFVLGLLTRDVPVDVYGNNWQEFLSHKNVRVYPPVYELDMWVTLRKYRVQLNMPRKHNLQSHNMRTFEIPGVGGIQLAPDTPEHQMFFKEGEEIFLYKDLDEAAKKAKSLISLTKVEADNIRQSALSRSINSGYSYKGRTGKVHEYFQDLLGKQYFLGDL